MNTVAPLKTPAEEQEEIIALLSSLSLDSLSELRRLDQLDKLKSLQHLEHLEKLSVIMLLTEALERHKDVLKPLETLPLLHKLEHLGKLEFLEKLEDLKGLNSLKRLENLSELQSLNQLEALKRLDSLKHLELLDDLQNLRSLKELEQLRDLENLQELVRLEQLKQLEKLDKIDDARFAERLSKLDKLDILEKGTKSLVVQQVVGTILEFVKLAVAGAVIVFLLTRESGRETVSKVLPAIGFGAAAQVNLGLKLLLQESTSEEFQEIVQNIRSRAQGELDAALSPDESLNLKRRLDLIGNVFSYHFKSPGVDLAKEIQTDFDKKILALHEKAIDTVSFELAQAEGRKAEKEIAQLREVKLLLIQKQFPQLLERNLPNWKGTQGLTMATVVAAANLRKEDPGTLEEILRKQLPGKEY